MPFQWLNSCSSSVPYPRHSSPAAAWINGSKFSVNRGEPLNVFVWESLFESILWSTFIGPGMLLHLRLLRHFIPLKVEVPRAENAELSKLWRSDGFMAPEGIITVISPSPSPCFCFLSLLVLSFLRLSPHPIGWKRIATVVVYSWCFRLKGHGQQKKDLIMF